MMFSMNRYQTDSPVTRLALHSNSAYLWSSQLHQGLHSLEAKRSLDVLIGTVAMILLSPLMLLVAVLIKLNDGGPVLFTQSRIGRFGVPFKFYKFRSMRTDAPKLKAALMGENLHGSGITFKLKRDPRITWIGRIIRKLSIDELPQLWNVLKGDMSLVGPRPPVPEEVKMYEPNHHLRFSVQPGITCLWQVLGRAKLPFDEQVLLDIEYIRNRTLWLDFRLLVMTVPAVVLCRGAY